MKELLSAIGQLVILKRINRKALEDSVGMRRTNMAASFHGNRTFPDKFLPKLRAALLLDKDYHFDPDHVHALWPRVGKFTPDEVLSVIGCFAAMPLQVMSFVQVIGELGVESTALAFNDASNCLIVLQHDDEKYLSEIQRLVTGCNSLTSEKIEIHINDFHTIVTDQKTPKQALEMLTKSRFVWTWQRIRNIAMNKGITPKEAAAILKLYNDDELCNE